MGLRNVSQRVCAGVVMLGISILLVRTVLMLSGGALGILVPWAGLLLIAEFLLDSGCFLTSIPWWISKDSRRSRLPLRLAAAAALLHAVRVGVFVLGRVGPWIDFDVRPEHRALHGARWTWFEVSFAAVMSVLGVLGVILVWRRIRRARCSSDAPTEDLQNSAGLAESAPER